MKTLILLLAAGVPANATDILRVFSEFTRFDPFGNIVKADRGTSPPRHILSPGFPRNGYASVRIVIRLDKPASFTLDIGQNPIDAVKVQLYREVHEEVAGEWIPDRLIPVGLPFQGSIPDKLSNVQGHNTVTLWLDMFVAPNADVDRIKVEPQLNVYDDWYTYPMEVRILEPVYSAAAPTYGSLVPAANPADHAAYGLLRQEFCGVREPPAQQVLTARQLIRRNVAQHLALGRAKGKPAMEAALLKASGAASIKAWCESSRTPPAGPEWYLRFRDALFR